MNPVVLSVKQLAITLPAGADRSHALEDVSLQLHAGETLCVVGESGSGKSTLALAVLGLQPYSGQLGFTLQATGSSQAQASPGQATWGVSASADRALRRHIQVVFQDPFSSLSPRMTVEAMVGEGLLVHAPELSEAQRQARVLAALAEVGMTDAQFAGLLQRYPHEFSGGQRQRAWIAMTIAQQTPLLLLDEASRVPDETCVTLRPMLAVSGGDLWLLSTPGGKSGFFWEAWELGGEEWARFRGPATECKRISAEWLESERRALGDRWFRQEYLCEFVADGSALFDREAILEAVVESEVW